MAIKELFQDSRPQVLFDPRASQRIDPRFKFTRDGVASYYDRDGVLRYAPVNQPRFDHDPATGESLGLLIEQARTNIIKSSNNFIFNDWHFTQCEMTPNFAIAPDETQTAALIQQTDGTSTRQFICTSYNVPSTASPWTASVYVKKYNYDYVIFGAGDQDSGFRGTRFGYLQAQLLFQFSTKTLTVNTSTNWGGNVTDYGYEELPNGWFRLWVSKASFPRANYWGIAIQQSLTGNSTISDDLALITGDGVSGVYVWGFQWETGSFPTSYIPTTSAQVTREPDLLSIEGTSLPSTGSIYIDARSLSSDVDDTLLSAANASDDKLTLAIRPPASLYNSKALVYEVDGAFKPTLPFPVPGVARERNLITYGANNYHYRSDSARLTPSSSTSVPANMTRLGIGHDVTDPTKAITGYINTIYLWPGEITPTVAEALVRGDVDPKDADAGAFTPETGALAFVFNTQGTATDGDRVVELPLGGSTNNILVDWGDNTSSSLIGAAASVTVNHTYPAAGIYPVQITADSDGTNSGLKNLEFYNNSPADLVRVLQWGGTTTWNPTTMVNAFRDCTQLDFENAARTNLPDTGAIVNWTAAFYNCSSISGTFPTFDTSAATTFNYTWYGCSSQTAFPFINSSNVTNFNQAWQGCSGLTSFPLIDTSAATGLYITWGGCSSLTSFPLINTSSATNFNSTWSGCSNLTSFPLIDTSSGENFATAWLNCSNLEDFPASFFDSWAGTPANQCFYRTWSNCNLTATSVDNILVSIAASGVSAPSGTGTNDKSITIDYDGTTLPGTTATAITTLKSRNWDIYLNGVQQ